jgi:lipopolysaccharide export system protein LptA
MSRIILSILLGFAMTIAIALPEDSNKSMHIRADSTMLNYKSGFNSYEGNVKLIQGETHLDADRVTTQTNDRHKIAEAIAYGKDKTLAHYWTIPRKGDPEFHAEAKVIKFYPIKSTVILEGDVAVKQGENSFHGPVIVYNMKDETIQVPPSDKGPATIVIQPTTKTS